MEWFYHDLAGIKLFPGEVAYGKIVISPTLVGDITWVKASFDSVHGRIESEWHRDGGKYTLRVVVPVNTTAFVRMPVVDATSVMESGRPAGQNPGVSQLPQKADPVEYEVGSGTYNFSCDLPTADAAKP
jgi:alpha-L-rhamnosidase